MKKSPKILIYHDIKELKPMGGPSGYLYNLNNELKKEGINSIDFINIPKSNKRIIFDKLPNKLKAFLKKTLNPRTREIIKNVFSDCEKTSCVDLNKYDIIHFHSSLSMYLVKDSLDKFHGKVVFTTHCPKVPHKEIIEDMTTKKFYNSHKKVLDKLEIIDEYAFNRADYIIFPTAESEECYYNTWEKYKEIKENNSHKYIYIPTGINPVTAKIDRKSIRDKYGIPKDAFLISYIGRHNEVKGYKFFKEIGKEFLKDQNNYVIVAGEEAPLKGLEDERWIEVGWTNDPYSIINASDVFVLPNKETYFDLVLLETMSLGKQVALSNTGGNKYFKKYNSKSLRFFEYGDINDALNAINGFKGKECGKLSEDIFNKEFLISIFTVNYLKVMSEIYNGDLNE